MVCVIVCDCYLASVGWLQGGTHSTYFLLQDIFPTVGHISDCSFDVVLHISSTISHDDI